MIASNPLAGAYVTLTHPVSAVGTFTGVPATTHGSYVSGTTHRKRVGQYTRFAPRRAYQRTPTGSLRLTAALAAH